MYSIIEPIEVSLLKLFSDILKKYNLKATFNYFETEEIAYRDSKIQELGFRAFLEKVKKEGDKLFTVPKNILVLYQRNTPIKRNSDYGLTGKMPLFNIIDNEKKVVIQKNFLQIKWNYEFIFVCKSREFEELLEFLFYTEIQYQKFLSFVLKINEYEIPLTYKLNIDDISDYGKLSEELIDNVYKFNFDLEISGPIFSPFSLDLPFIEGCRTEIIAVSPDDMHNPSEAIQEGRFELVSNITCKDKITFNDPEVIQSFTKDKNELLKKKEKEDLKKAK